MGANDEAPYPLNGTAAIMKALVAGADRLNQPGPVRLVADIDSTGAVPQVMVLEAPNDRI